VIKFKRKVPLILEISQLFGACIKVTLQQTFILLQHLFYFIFHVWMALNEDLYLPMDRETSPELRYFGL